MGTYIENYVSLILEKRKVSSYGVGYGLTTMQVSVPYLWKAGSTFHHASATFSNSVCTNSSTPNVSVRRHSQSIWPRKRYPEGVSCSFLHGISTFQTSLRESILFERDEEKKTWRLGCTTGCGDGGRGREWSDKASSIDTLEGGNASQRAFYAEGGDGIRGDAEAGDAWEVDVEDEDVRVLAKCKSMYNFVQVLEVARRADHPLAGARILLLDRPGNIQSVYQPYKVITDSYYDLFASLPPLLPDGPVGILGLGAGTAARVIHHFWPYVNMHGWELDPTVIMVARQFFSLSELEDGSKALQRRVSVFSPVDVQCNEEDDSCYAAAEEENSGTRERDDSKQPGRLVVHVGNALDAKATIEGGFAGLIVDIFSEGAVIPELQQPQTWQLLQERLQPGGRIMVNCGGSCVEAEGKYAKDGEITMEETIAAMTRVFPGTLLRTKLRGSGNNSLTLTGPLPDLHAWEQALPEALREGIHDWVSVP